MWDIVLDIYEAMYREAVPPLDFRKALNDGYCSRKDWFLDHFLPMERQEEIFEEFMKRYRCSRLERKKIGFEVWLGSSPSAVVKGGGVDG